MASIGSAQDDPLQHLDNLLKKATGDRLYFTFEERTRWEEKFGVSFGKAVNQQDMLSRLRIGMGVDPTSWLTVYAMGQDTRAPFYGVPAPNTLRDTMDLQEAYIKLFDHKDTGFGAAFGRSMLDYGDSRVIGTPQWTNVARTYDQGRLYYRTRKARVELLMVSPVKVLPDAFNKPELGERIWGTYDALSKVWRGASLDVYALRHSQNKIGGWDLRNRYIRRAILRAFVARPCLQLRRHWADRTFGPHDAASLRLVRGGNGEVHRGPYAGQPFRGVQGRVRYETRFRQQRHL